MVMFYEGSVLIQELIIYALILVGTTLSGYGISMNMSELIHTFLSNRHDRSKEKYWSELRNRLEQED